MNRRRFLTIGAAAIPISVLGGWAGVRYFSHFWQERGAHFESQGVQVGERMPNLMVVTEDGGHRPISQLWDRGPVILVTGSVTCPVSRKSLPGAEKLARQYRDRMSVAVLYTLEAHPSGDDSPYLEGREWQMEENLKEGIVRSQPDNLDEREQLADELKARLNLSLPIMLDEMENDGWKSFGRGPNVAVLIDSHGIVRAKQGWFDEKQMREEIQDLLDR